MARGVKSAEIDRGAFFSYNKRRDQKNKPKVMNTIWWLDSMTEEE